MQIKIFNNGRISSNSYLLIGQDNRAVLIDAGGNAADYLAAEKEGGFVIDYVLLTHGHFDHSWACADLQAAGKKIGICKEDEIFLRDKSLVMFKNDYKTLTADFYFGDGESLNLCGIDIKVIATPGHTAGGVCFLTENMLFTGDTLFYLNVGRTDMYSGDYPQLEKSVKDKLYALDDGTVVYPGHGQATTIGFEKIHNDYIKA